MTWTESKDPDSNTVWHAPGPWADVFEARWELSQKIQCGQIVWVMSANRDELQGEWETEFWTSIAEAKDAIEQIHNEMISDAENCT